MSNRSPRQVEYASRATFGRRLASGRFLSSLGTSRFAGFRPHRGGGRVAAARGPGGREWVLRVPIHLTAMADFDDAHHPRSVVNLVDDPVWALANSVAIVIHELLGTWRPRIISKLGNAIHDEPTILLRRQILNFAGSRAPDLEAISSDAASDLRTTRSKERLGSVARSSKAARSSASSARLARTASFTRSDTERSVSAALWRSALWMSGSK